MKPTLDRALISWILPLGLWGLTWLLGGFHYETNDDLVMSFIARGLAFGEPVGDYSLYFHGFGQLFVWLYQHFPNIAWYGLILYLLLFICTHLVFKLVYRYLKPHLNFRAIFLFLVLFYVANWYEHAFWFNYMRVPLLLAGLAFLNLISFSGPEAKYQVGKAFIYGGLFLLALAIRPGAALLGILLVLPAFGYVVFRKVDSKKTVLLSLLPLVVAGFVFVILLQFTAGEEASTYRKLDTLKSGLVDYQWCCDSPKTPENALILRGFNHWFLADPAAWINWLSQKNVYPDWSYVLQKTIPAKFIQAFKYLLFDQFLILFLIGGILIILYQQKAGVNFKQILGAQLFFWSLILGIALVLKLPPRVLTPALSLVFLVNLSFLPVNFSGLKKLPLAFKIVFILLLGLQVFKIANRMQWQQNQQTKAENYLTAISNNFQNRTIILTDFGGDLRALSPFTNYSFGPNQVLMLTGWHTLDPHFRPYLQKLSGRREVIPALVYLSEQPEVVWVMRPEFKAFLEHYLAHFSNTAGNLEQLKGQVIFQDQSLKAFSLPE